MGSNSPTVKVHNPNRPFYLGEHVIDVMWVVIDINWHDSRPLRVAFDDYPYQHRDGYPKSLLYCPDGTHMLSATIAETAGYSSESSFHKAFVREFGCSPGEYRRRVHALEQ
jgi:hypothetical protein